MARLLLQKDSIITKEMDLRKTLSVMALIALAATSALAHAGHMHTYMGTVTMLHGSDAFMIKTSDGKDVTVRTSAKTTYLHAGDHPAKQSELAVGERVVVKMSLDGKTAATVKIGPAKKTK